MVKRIRLSKVTGFDWDKSNITKNWEKHKVYFLECEEIFLNRPRIVLHNESHSQDEGRFAILGITNRGRELFIVFTVRGSKIRVISARDQSKKERQMFENYKRKKNREKNENEKRKKIKEYSKI